MRYDFDSVGDDRFMSVPAGDYDCRVEQVREGTARDGSVRWTLKLVVIAGDYAGRIAGWDSLTWSDRGVHRVQQVLCALGVDARGEVELEPHELVGRSARVSFEVEEYEDAMTGRRVLRLRVPYSGYRPLEAHEANGAIDAEGGGEGSSGDGPSLEGAAAAAF